MALAQVSGGSTTSTFAEAVDGDSLGVTFCFVDAGDQVEIAVVSRKMFRAMSEYCRRTRSLSVTQRPRGLRNFNELLTRLECYGMQLSRLRELYVNVTKCGSEFTCGINLFCTSFEKMTFTGLGSSQCFTSISASCASSLKNLELHEGGFGKFVNAISGDFKSLEKVTFGGPGSSQCFDSISASCACSLKSLVLYEGVGEFVNAIGGDFKSLEKVTFRGLRSSQCFDSISASCACSLKSLVLYEEGGEFVNAICGVFTSLEEVTFHGNGCRSCFERMDVYRRHLVQFSERPTD
eukprot:GHVT01088742.1.p1 GENE.GHVT01088742.1~~GHVT01088742.1.p1  ORF type:complete len:305 (+),score=0.32 GHVT01088742.1:38-916(+)